MTDHVVLDGTTLSPLLVHRIAHGASVSLAPGTVERMARGRLVIDRYLSESIPAYGLTTGLGMRSDQMLTADAAAEFSYRMVRGRAQAVGALLRAEEVRAVMAVRINTLLSGAAGASSVIAPSLVHALNAGFIAAMPRIGSIGTGDLVAMASLAHALIGEGEALVGEERVPAADSLTALSLAALRLLPKDGAVLCNNTAFSTALASLASVAARNTLVTMQVAGALSLEGFVGNLTPFSAASLRARPQPGQVEAGDQIRHLLADGPLGSPRAARRLQDPLSFRCMAQLHGASFAALRDLDEELAVDLNSSPDNPVVSIEENLCVSTGNFQLPRLTQTLDSLARSLAWCATDSVSRVQRLMHAAHSGLPPLLSSDTPDTAGFGPLLKPMEALRAEIVHLSTPVPVLASHNADGVEDSVTFAALAATKLAELVGKVDLLVSFELVAACQAVDLRTGGPSVEGPAVAPSLAPVYDAVRQRCGFLGEDRPIGREIEAIARELVATGALVSAAGLAT
jgi:histidine ammonia-lyase